MSHITSYCLIRNHQVIYNGNVIFQAAHESDDFIDTAFQALQIQYPKYYKMDRLSKMGFVASEVVLKNAEGLSEAVPERRAVLVSNRSSSLDTDRRYLESSRQIASPSLFVYTLPNIMIGEICIRHGFKGANVFFIFNEFNAGFMVQQVEQLLNKNKADICLAGWVEVLDQSYDVFLYRVERTRPSNGWEHTTKQVITFYNQ